MVVSSGNQTRVSCRRTCPRFLRQTFHGWAVHSVSSSAWAKVYYDRQRTNGKAGSTASRALAYKWVRILFRCWKNRSRTPKPHISWHSRIVNAGSTALRCAIPVEKRGWLLDLGSKSLLTDQLRC